MYQNENWDGFEISEKILTEGTNRFSEFFFLKEESFSEVVFKW